MKIIVFLIIRIADHQYYYVVMNIEIGIFGTKRVVNANY